MLSDEALLAVLQVAASSLAVHSFDAISIDSRTPLVGAAAATNRTVEVMNLMV